MEKRDLDDLIRQSHEESKRGVQFVGYTMVFIGVAGIALAFCAYKFDWF